MSVGDIIQHLYLPLLTQETAVMVSAFTYSLKAGVGTPLLVVVNTIAVVTDLLIFFVPIHFLSQRLHDRLIARFQERYDTGMGLVSRFGAFRTATVVAFVMPSVVAMVVVGLLRLSFWRALAGLFAGSAAYVVLPLLIALPLASRLPRFIVPVLPWMSPVLALVIVIVALFRLWNGRREPLTEGM